MSEQRVASEFASEVADRVIKSGNETLHQNLLNIFEPVSSKLTEKGTVLV